LIERRKTAKATTKTVADTTEQSKPVAGRIGDEISHLPPVSFHRTDLLLN